MIPIALTIAGSDSGGGAGIQADLKTFSALGVYGASVITALTAQNTEGVKGVLIAPPDFVTAQIEAVTSDLDIAAIKIGMLGDVPTIGAVADALRALPNLPRIPVILDPVMVAASGDPLLDDGAVESLQTRLFPLTNLITPNLHEAARMLGASPAEDEAGMIAQAEQLFHAGAPAVLVKGGHLPGDRAVDILYDGEVRCFAETKIDTKNTHGTGCTLSSAIAAEMAKGAHLGDAVAAAKRYMTGAIAAADQLKIGKGCGPVHHFYRLWPEE
ncbi:bifunctional hydroxymethylpyrimidine kinase/phosphomethylpyrimidine kinase [Methyloligella sp. 2.7D]|uniref:bifunctional hydroxymethylpyrimidine kinase/phosphomethylpyrimidine kinase n=1 Tax=unclassified Methyloligella TaxID=2625955 RepID=UPI00157C3E37|nr:bifunctional hydroxymethylpyrimidine kinase/phosphomethylpyrimidine kinase [Methyloligella sp. GL2]QKP77889.1 bifunctional hydroxymethylpyrimidine kinase/phosphomethylpyrimidine kinase [Methyloligella sp. GL2]